MATTRKSLTLGSSDTKAVKALQALLGHKETGNFTQATEEAVMNYQRAASLTPTGVVDDATWKALHR